MQYKKRKVSGEDILGVDTIWTHYEMKQTNFNWCDQPNMVSQNKLYRLRKSRLFFLFFILAYELQFGTGIKLSNCSWDSLSPLAH